MELKAIARQMETEFKTEFDIDPAKIKTFPIVAGTAYAYELGSLGDYTGTHYFALVYHIYNDGTTYGIETSSRQELDLWTIYLD